MAKKTKATGLAASAMTLLGAIVTATQAGGYEMIGASDDAKALQTGGFIEVNTEITNDAGQAAARATEKGIQHMTQNQSGTAPASTAATAAPKFEIETAPVEIFTAKRGSGVRTSIYPFDSLPAPVEGQPMPAFFVPATEDRPEPWKTLASTVSSASKRYAKKTGEETYTAGDGTQKTRATFDYERKFKLAAGEKNGVKGAWIGRVK